MISLMHWFRWYNWQILVTAAFFYTCHITRVYFSHVFSILFWTRFYLGKQYQFGKLILICPKVNLIWTFPLFWFINLTYPSFLISTFLLDIYFFPGFRGIKPLTSITSRLDGKWKSVFRILIALLNTIGTLHNNKSK